MERIKTIFRNIWIHVRWFISAVPINLFGVLTAPFMFPLAWLCKGLGKWSPFWIWLHDGRITDTGYASDYEVFLRRKGLETENFKIAWYWMVSRNRVINLRGLLKVPSAKFEQGGGNNNIVITKTIIDNLTRYDGTKYPQDGRWEARAEIKYLPENPNDDIWQVNTGNIQSNRTSIIGTGYILYKIGDWHSFRYSKSFEIKAINRNCTIWMGTNNSTNMLACKFQKIKPWDINIKTNK
jgi:hypothetical protein